MSPSSPTTTGRIGFIGRPVVFCPCALGLLDGAYYVVVIILAPRCQTKDLIFVAHMIKYQPFGTLLVVHSVSFGEFYYCSTFASMTKKARQMKEVRFPLTLHYHDLTNFF